VGDLFLRFLADFVRRQGTLGLHDCFSQGSLLLCGVSHWKDLPFLNMISKYQFQLPRHYQLQLKVCRGGNGCSAQIFVGRLSARYAVLNAKGQSRIN